MLETANGWSHVSATGAQHHENMQALHKQKVLRMRTNDRMAGSVPVWTVEKTAKETVSQSLSLALNGISPSQQSFETALAYAQESNGSAANSDEFGFGDILDMVNPLHHIPLIGSLYRELTGDEIKPISKIIGGGVFGGASGAASGLVNVIIEEETGKDIAGNVMSMISGGDEGSGKIVPDHPEKRLNHTIKRLVAGENTELPGSVIAFADLGGGKQKIYERTEAAGGRTAGTMVSERKAALEYLPPREPITKLALSPMPKMKLNN